MLLLLLQWQNPWAQTTLSQYDITAYYNILLYCTRVYTVIFLPGNLKTHNIIDSVAAKRLVISDFVCLYKISNRVIDPSARLLMFPYIILYIYIVLYVTIGLSLAPQIESHSRKTHVSTWQIILTDDIFQSWRLQRLVCIHISHIVII